MPNGRLGNQDLVANTNTIVYTPSPGKVGVFSVSICNRNATGVSVAIALAANSTPANSQYIEFQTTIPGNGVLERTGLTLNDSQSVVVWANASFVSAVVYGLEQSLN